MKFESHAVEAREVPGRFRGNHRAVLVLRKDDSPERLLSAASLTGRAPSSYLGLWGSLPSRRTGVYVNAVQVQLSPRLFHTL